MSLNPYKNRKLPVGALKYTPKSRKNLSKARHVHCMLEYGEPQLIYDIPQLVDGGSILNLGDARGGSATLLALGLQEHDLFGHVWTVDNYNRPDARHARSRFELAGVSDLITQVLGCTQDKAVLEELKVRRYSFVFVDAGHTYRDVHNDWINYGPLVSKTGIIGFHDTNQIDINRVIEEIEEDGGWEQTHWINRIKCYRRKQ